jgi:protease I
MNLHERIGGMSEPRLNRRDVCRLLAAGPCALALAAASARAADQPAERGKVLMPIGDATETMDTLYPFFRIPEDGYRVVVAGPEARLYHTVLHEVPPNSDVPWDITRETAGYHLKAEAAFRDVNPADYVGLFVSGGRAPEYLRYDQDLMRITRHFFEADKPVAVICHGVEIVTAAGVIKGRRCTTVAKCAMDANQGGGTYVDEPVVVDGNMVSARTWHDNTPFLKQFMKMLNAYRDRR